jgi:glycerate kinase
VVELADACGLSRLPGGVLKPMTASSFGLGQLLSAAVRSGAKTVVLGVGGSAGTDGGAGMLQALGARILDEAGRPISPGGGGLSAVHSLDLSGLDPAVAGVRVVLASDVDNPLLGPNGAATVYAPQKGADPAQVADLESALSTWSDVVQATVGADFSRRPGAGAAGGVGFAALAVLGAEFRSGIELVFELVDFQQALSRADLVITGEGSLDRQTLQGKGPAGVAVAGRAAGVPVVAIAGRVLLTGEELAGAGFSRAYSLLELAPDTAASMSNPGPLLEAVGRQVILDFQRWCGCGPRPPARQ